MVAGTTIVAAVLDSSSSALTSIKNKSKLVCLIALAAAALVSLCYMCSVSHWVGAQQLHDNSDELL
jgi:hypothetical protein